MLIRVDRTWMVDLGVMAILLGLLYLTFLGHRPLFVPDEGRYAEIAREMAESNNFITPYLNYIKYFEKPPLFYWLGAIFIKGLGPTVAAVRLINALLCIIGCFATYITARLLFDRRTGLFSAYILATSGLYFVMGHTISLDLPVTVFMSISLYAIMLFANHTENRYQSRSLYVAAIFAACAVLTKGLIGLLLPALIVFIFIGITRDLALLRALFSWRIISVFILIALPWHIAVSIQNPEFPYFYIVEQHFLRYSKIGIGHYQPAWFFIPWLILGLFPSIIFLFDALSFHIKQSIKHNSIDRNALFLGIWVATIFVFFSFSKSKLIPYILPLFPAISILIGRYVSIALQTFPDKILRSSLYLYTLFTIVVTIVFACYLRNTTLPDALFASISLGMGCSLLWLSTILCWYKRKQAILHAIITLYIGSALFWLSIIIATPALDTRSILPLAEYLSSVLTQQDEIISYNRYYQDLPFYLKRRATIINWQNELRFGMNHQNTDDWMLSHEEFIRKINILHHNHLYIFMNKEDWAHLKPIIAPKGLHVIKTTINDVLVTNSK